MTSNDVNKAIEVWSEGSFDKLDIYIAEQEFVFCADKQHTVVIIDNCLISTSEEGQIYIDITHIIAITLWEKR